MIRRLVTAAFLVSGLALLGVAGVGYFSPVDDAEVTIDGPDRDLTDCPTGQTADFAFRIHNPTSRTIRVVGLDEC